MTRPRVGDFQVAIREERATEEEREEYEERIRREDDEAAQLKYEEDQRNREE